MVFREALRQVVSQCRRLVFRFSSTNMQNAYIRYPSGSSKFDLTFHYSNQNLGLDRKFNFTRQCSESVSTLLERIQQNLQKFLEKKRKRKQKNGKSATDSKEDALPTVVVELLRNGQIVPADEVLSSLLGGNELLMLSVLGKKYHVVLNAPWITKIQLPNSILCGFPVYPSKFTGDFIQKSDCIFLWYRKVVEDWVQVGSGFVYTPSIDDIGHFLKVNCEPRRGSIAGPVNEAVSKCSVEAGPGPCPFETRHAFTKERAEGKSFRVTSYNILAGLYSDTDVAKTDLFSHCPMYALNIDYRKQLLLKEILGYNADIICLQEVDSDVFDEDLMPNLALEGFDGVYHKKGNSVREGLASFIKADKFSIVSSQLSVLSSELSERPCYAGLWEKVKHNEALVARLKDKPTSSQATVLRSTENPDDWLVVGNTHLYFHPDADHIRLLQAGQSILFLEEVIETVKQENPGSQVSLLFCGDFNSTSDCGVFSLMTTGYVPENVDDWESNKEEKITGLSLSQPFKLDSACGIPNFTNYTVGFKACIDYIFYEMNKFEVKQVLPFYSEEELQRYVALPNAVFPSDHVALVVDLQKK